MTWNLKPRISFWWKWSDGWRIIEFWPSITIRCSKCWSSAEIGAAKGICDFGRTCFWTSASLRAMVMDCYGFDNRRHENTVKIHETGAIKSRLRNRSDVSPLRSYDWCARTRFIPPIKTESEVTYISVPLLSIKRLVWIFNPETPEFVAKKFTDF